MEDLRADESVSGGQGIQNARALPRQTADGPHIPTSRPRSPGPVTLRGTDADSLAVRGR